jgi:hypothetical protein
MAAAASKKDADTALDWGAFTNKDAGEIPDPGHSIGITSGNAFEHVFDDFGRLID